MTSLNPVKLSHGKNLPTFHYTGCLKGIVIMLIKIRTYLDSMSSPIYSKKTRGPFSIVQFSLSQFQPAPAAAVVFLFLSVASVGGKSPRGAQPLRTFDRRRLPGREIQE